MRALLAAAKQADVDCNQDSWCAFCSMSRFDASFPMQVEMMCKDHVQDQGGLLAFSQDSFLHQCCTEKEGDGVIAIIQRQGALYLRKGAA